jgi:hypothetical protein
MGLFIFCGDARFGKRRVKSPERKGEIKKRGEERAP